MTQEEIDAAADELLAAAGEEKLRRFRERFSTDAEIAEAERRGERFITTEVTLPANLADPGPIDRNLPAYIESVIRTACEGHDVVDAKLIAEQIREQVLGEKGRARVASFSRDYEAVGDGATTDVFVLLLGEMSADADITLHNGMNYYAPQHWKLMGPALRFGTKLEFALSVRLANKKICGGISKIVWRTPLTERRRAFLRALLGMVKAGALYARTIGSDAYPEWREAALLVHRTVGGPDATADDIARPFPEKTVARLLDVLASARAKTFFDGQIFRLGETRKEGADER